MFLDRFQETLVGFLSIPGVPESSLYAHGPYWWHLSCFWIVYLFGFLGVFFPFATGLLYGNGRLRQAVNYLVELSGYRRRMLRLMIKW